MPLSPTPTDPAHPWYVYIIRTLRDRLYTGITTDIERRWAAHVSGKTGAKFLRSDKPAQLVMVEVASDRSSASKREAQIKRLTRQQKLLLIRAQGPVYFPTNTSKVNTKAK